MSLKDKRDQLARSQEPQDMEPNSSEQGSSKGSLRNSLKERQKILSDDVARQNRLKDALEQGERFYKNASASEKTSIKEGLLLSAKKMFEAATEIDSHNPSAREGLIRVLNAFAEEAKRTHRYEMALDYYQTLEKNFQEPTAAIFIEEVKRLIVRAENNKKYRWIGGGFIGVLLFGFLLIQGLHLIAWPSEICDGVGGKVLCDPTLTSTLAPTFTPTLRSTPVPSVTPTITLTPTPFVYQARLNNLNNLVPYYPDPESREPSGFTSDGQFVYVCAKDEVRQRYLISLDYCFNPLQPLGWINRASIVMMFEGDLPSVLITPSH